MEHSSIELNDLPDEILIYIFRKLDNCDVLYSLIGVNKRLHIIANDLIFTKSLTFRTPLNGLNQFTDIIVDRFCLEILPKIHHKIEWLNLESSYIERILLLTNYPNLYGLGLYDLASVTDNELFTDRSFLIRVFKSQISALVIHIKKSEEPRNSFETANTFIYTQIFTMFNNLQYLNFSSSCDYQQLTFNRSPPIVFSSTLLELHVEVLTIKDCLHLLDGHFNQLYKFCVTIYASHVPVFPVINNEKEIPNLKCFTLTHKTVFAFYDRYLIPLLHRMSNLEQLTLYFVCRCGAIIDGNSLEMNIINHMRKLNKFTFNIYSLTPRHKLVKLPSNQDVKNTFKNFKNQIISCVDYFRKEKLFYCHIYSYPHTLSYYHNITNNFRGGLFVYVRQISLFDERPFEHKFFLRIYKSFPFIEEITLHNYEPQKNDNEQWSIIHYSHLIKLDLIETHENYVEQFLINTKMCLLNNIYLHVAYDCLQKVTDNFTRDATRDNCSKIKCLFLYNKPEFCSPYLENYFPHALIYQRVH